MDNFHDHSNQPLRQNNASHLEITLDAASNLLALAVALFANNTSIKSLKANIHQSFMAGTSHSEILFLFEALGSRPHLQEIVIRDLRRLRSHPNVQAAPLPIQALSLALIQASKLQVLQLSFLTFSGTTSDFTTLGASLQNHPSLQEIDISNCCLEAPYREDDYEAGEAFAMAGEPATQDNNCILDPLIKALATIQPLKKVTLNATIQNEMGNMSPASLGFLIRHSTNLQSIDLQGFALTHGHIAAMIPGLCGTQNDRLSSLKEICLGTIQLGELGDKSLAQILQSNTTLEYVDLKLDDGDSSVHVAKALIDNHGSLRHLFIHGNITPISQQSFAEAMEFNYVLESMELMNGSAEYLPAIRFYLRMNAIGRRELLMGPTDRSIGNTNAIGASKSKWVEALITHRKDSSALFYLLSVNPLLCADVQ